jgi:hypothetical protein
MAPGIAGVPGLTVILISLLVASVGEAQGILEVITTVTLSPCINDEMVKVELFVPALTPFIFHWYTGFEPPLTGVAVNETVAPGHIVVLSATIDTDGVTTGLTVIVIVLLVAGLLIAQLAFEVTTTLT